MKDESKMFHIYQRSVSVEFSRSWKINQYIRDIDWALLCKIRKYIIKCNCKRLTNPAMLLRGCIFFQRERSGKYDEDYLPRCHIISILV